MKHSKTLLKTLALCAALAGSAAAFSQSSAAIDVRDAWVRQRCPARAAPAPS